jgi:hypothetical protein
VVQGGHSPRWAAESEKQTTGGNYFDNCGDVMESKIHKRGLSISHFTFKLFKDVSSNAWTRQRKSCYESELEMT